VSFEVPRGGTLGIVGESGSGKSTTARIAAKLIDPTAGTLEFDGADVTNAGGRELAEFRQNVQVVFQDPFSSLNPKHTVEKIVAAPLDYQRLTPKQGRRALVRELLERVGLNPDHAQRYPGQFSGGQAQRIGIARALAVKPKLVICDEAVSALDVSVQAKVINLLNELQAELGLSYIFIAHDLAVVRQIADTVAVMHRGRIVEQGTRDDIFGRPQHDYTKTLLAAVPQINPEWELERVRMLAAEGAVA
jgi:peptide/nickel transport system ATP-binding protein